jgi:hypothetical protein
MDLRNSLETIKEQIQAREQELAALRNLEAQMENAIGVLAGTTVPTIVAGPYRGLSIAEAAKNLWNEKQTPLTTREIAEGLIEKGMRTNSKNYNATVYAVLNVTSGWNRNKKNQWEFKD